MKRILALLTVGMALATQAATITGNLVDVSELALSPTLTFTPTSTPYAHTNGATVLDTPKTVRVTNGTFSVNLLGGYYTTAFGPFSKPKTIYVPFYDTNTYGFNYVASLATNVPNYVATNWSYLISQHVQAGSGIALTTNSPNSANEKVVISSVASGLSVAQGTNIVLVTNGAVVTIHGTGGGGGTTYTFIPTNLAAGILVTNGSTVFNGTNLSSLATVTALVNESNRINSAFTSVNTASNAAAAALTVVSNQTLTVSNYAAPRAAFDLVQQDDSYTTTDSTNTLFVDGGGAVVYNRQWWWHSPGNRYTNTSSTTHFITNNGAFWTIGRTTAPSGYTNANLIGEYSVDSGTAPAPTVRYGTNIVGTNYVWRQRSDWALLGMVFEGGGNNWPPSNVDERGRIAVSGTGKDWSVSKQPQLIGSAGHLRDASLLLHSNVFWCAYTTNSATNASQTFSIARSTNLTHWLHYTNISPALSGETLTSSARVWGPVFYQQAGSTNIWLVSAVDTNYVGNGDFRMRVQRTTVGQFPDGWSTAVVMSNATGYSNIIELTFGQDTNGTLYAFGTGTDSGTLVNHIRQFSFATADDLTSTMSLVSAAPVANWGQAAEGVSLVRLWNGMWRLYWVFYYGNQNGAFGDGQNIRYSDTTNLSTAVWSDPRMADFDGFYAQNFKPLVLTDREHIDLAANAVKLAGDMGGIFHVPSRYGDRVFNGAAYISTRGLNRATNDVAAVNLGNSIWSLGGIYADTNNLVHLYAPTQHPTSEGNDVIDHGVTNVISLRSNSVIVRVALTNSGPFTQTGPMTNYNNVYSTGRFSGANDFPAWNGIWAAQNNAIGTAGGLGLVAANGSVGSGIGNVNYYASILPAGTYTNLWVALSHPTIAAGTNVVFIIYTNGVSSGMTATINGVTSGTIARSSNTTASITVALPTAFTMVLTNSSAGAINGSYGSWTLGEKLQ